MTFPKIFKHEFFTHQKALLKRVSSVECLRLLSLSSTTELTEQQLETFPERKLLKVAIVGRPNAGKSTLVNSILNLNLCGVSHKSHTTKTHFKAAFTKGDTQVVFVDTPGLVTRKEFARFNLSDNFKTWKNRVLKEADVIGVIHEVSEPRDVHKLHLNLVQHIQEFPEDKTLFLVLNKIDLVRDTEGLWAALKQVMTHQELTKSLKVMTPQDLSKSSEVCSTHVLNKSLTVMLPEEIKGSEPQSRQKLWKKFSKIFLTVASRNRGVQNIVDYLMEQAKPGNWIFEPGQIYDKPLNFIVLDLLRAQLLEILPHEIPYQCKYEIEYLKENNLGEIICVSLVTCKCPRHLNLITRNRKMMLKDISRNLESDLYKILNKVFRIRIVVVCPKKKTEPKK